MTKEETFYLEEYRGLKNEIEIKLTDVRAFNRWGLIGLAALYSYILSNPGKTILFWVPVFFSASVIAHINEEYRMIEKAALYIKNEIHPWIAGGKSPRGWEIFLADSTAPTPAWWLFWKRWPWHLWDWSPIPMWIVLFVITLILAVAGPPLLQTTGPTL